MKMDHLIVEWNKERGLLAKGFDPALELKMLTEEANEFYNADSFEHRMCEYADFKFVKVGTKAKYYAQTDMTTTMFKSHRDSFIQMMEWAEEAECNMLSLLSSEMEVLNKAGVMLNSSLDFLLDLALSTVISNNNLKGKATVDGKIVKAEDQTKPEEAVRRYVQYAG